MAGQHKYQMTVCHMLQVSIYSGKLSLTTEVATMATVDAKVVVSGTALCLRLLLFGQE